MKLFEVLKDFAQGLAKFEKGAQVTLTEAAAKYAKLSGKIKEVQAEAPAIIAEAKAVEANVVVAAAVVSNVVTEAQSVVANAVVVANDVKATVDAVTNKASKETPVDGGNAA